jgi:hypothetical protein
MAKIFPFASVNRKLSGSRPEWRLITSGARAFAAAIASSSVAKTQVSFSTGMAPFSQSTKNKGDLLSEQLRTRFGCGSLGLDVSRADYLRPFLGFIADELAEIGWRAREHHATNVGEPRLHSGIAKGSIDLFV